MTELSASGDLAAGFPGPDGELRLRPRVGELARITGSVISTSSPWGRHAEAERWAAEGLRPPRHHIRMAASALTDELFLNVIRTMISRPAGLAMGRIVAETHAAAALYRTNGWLDEPALFNREPEPLAGKGTVLRLRDLQFRQLRASEPWCPPAGSPGADRWLAYPGGQRALAHVLMHEEPRPWLVLVHGAYMGDLKIDCSIFDVERLHRGLGLNLAMPTLPLHGERAPKKGVSRSLPSLDTMDSIHGLAQAASEVRALLAWVRNEQPEQRVGMYGVSLGAYVASLVAGLESPLDCLIAGVPAVDFPAVFHSQTPRDIRSQAFYEPFREAVASLYRAVSPLAVTPATPLSERYLYGARGDRVLPPGAHSIKLWQHWGRPTSYWFDGAHVPQVRNKKIRAFVADALKETLTP